MEASHRIARDFRQRSREVMPKRSRCFVIAMFSTLVGAASPIAAPQTPISGWHDTFTSRLEALALLQSLNADLLSHDSATLTLDRWCAAHHLADPATITAERVQDIQKPATAAQRELLHVSETEPLGYRRVRLHCGSHVLSEADNWYVPSRLTSDMNQALEHSDIAFGRAISALRFQRHTLTATLLWAPLPEGWEMSHPASRGTPGELNVPPYVLQHTAVLSLPDGTPISALTETYTAEVLAFPEPALKRSAR
jgi:chorismate-pyruvate lyase